MTSSSPLIRLAVPSDAAQIAAIYAPFCAETPVSFETVAPAPEEMERRILKITERLPWLVLEQQGHIAGYVYASPHRDRTAYQWSVDVGVYVASEYRRRGVGRALYTSLLKILALQGYFKAYAGITLPNAGSVGLHQAMGFRPVGIYRGVGYKLGQWHDVEWFQLDLQPERPEPPTPRSFHELLSTPGWTEAIASGERLLRDNRSRK
jgi:L-amino acid N-acyltransferase YncA